MVKETKIYLDDKRYCLSEEILKKSNGFKVVGNSTSFNDYNCPLPEPRTIVSSSESLLFRIRYFVVVNFKKDVQLKLIFNLVNESEYSTSKKLTTKNLEFLKKDKREEST